jgi:hypothetical protein
MFRSYPRFPRFFRIVGFAWRSCFCTPVFIYLFPPPIFGWLVILFSTAFFFLFSSLASLPLFLYFVARFLSSCCVAVHLHRHCLSAVSLFVCLFVFLPTINYTITGQRFRHQRHCSLHDTMYVIVSAFGIDIDGKRVLHNLLLIPRFIFCDWHQYGL